MTLAAFSPGRLFMCSLMTGPTTGALAEPYTHYSFLTNISEILFVITAVDFGAFGRLFMCSLMTGPTTGVLAKPCTDYSS